MRFHRLDLVRYGKFTDRRLEFPRAPRDFHMVVGPNEAGKSTLRQAFYDLLFGFHVRTPLDFLHPKSELRLAAAIEQAGGVLEFQRTKGNKNTLRGPDDLPLPDTVLDPYLGTATGDFFDKMFGLDHPRLVQGGNDMLKAQDDVGQVLFQAAAGVASLGKVYEALQAEAALLWAPKKSKDRQWYAAQAQLDEANAALKAVTVRTREWADAHKHVQDLQTAVHGQRERHSQLLAKRTMLERIRRLAPGVIALAANEKLLRELGQVIALPADAAAVLASAEIELARAEQRLSIHGAEADRLKKVLAGIAIDDDVLALAADIEALETMRHRYGTHAQNIERYQGETASLWKDATDAAAQLGWVFTGQLSLAAAEQPDLVAAFPESEFSRLQTRLPALPVRRQIEQLVRDHASLAQALQSTERAMQSRRTEIDTLKVRLAELPSIAIQPALRTALDQAVSLGEPQAAIHKAVQATHKAQTEFDLAVAALPGEFKTVSQLMALQAPSPQTLARMAAQRLELMSDLKAARTRHTELLGTVQERELAIHQYQQLHHPVTRDDVVQARQERDGTWQSIRSGAVAVAAAAQAFEQSIGQSDALADARLDNVQEAAELQSRQHLLEQAQQKRDHAQEACLTHEKSLQEFDERWQATCKALGLRAMSLDQVADWVMQKDKVLAAAERLATARQEQEGLADRQAQVQAALLQALLAAGLPADGGADISALRLQANDYVGMAENAKVRRAALSDQLTQAEPILAGLQEARDTALGDMDRWRRDWAIALGNASLSADSEIAAAQGALALMEIIAEKLRQIRQRRIEHIDVMLSELQGFLASATQLGQALGGNGACSQAGADPAQISRELNARLSLARQSQKQAVNVRQEMAHVESQLRLAHESIQLAGASLQPLLERTGASNKDELRHAIVRSDQHRNLAQAVALAGAELLENGDGHTREQIQAEIDGADLARLAADLDALNADISAATTEQTRVEVELADAVRKLDAISGNDAAARAESQRQEALSGMADATERYIKVFTAARLLRWSIDRYREEKQGPMLARAGAIFSQLTLGSFERLAVDFDREPMVLEGVRAEGGKVGIGGLSDGTRDQLYLALRLAALELHLQQAAALPFIADDLFINYDDARAKAGLMALAVLSEKTQVIFLSHHDHLLDTARSVFGHDMNVVML
ncbi:MAG TPA: AAA family ATPase [Candidimonas sp.]|nr:AAA family ATPase [Candidimonas sp.]